MGFFSSMKSFGWSRSLRLVRAFDFGRDVAALVEEMCDYVNDAWSASTPLHLASYLMWRINWIHPFAGGNGRTSRAVSYLVLCARLGYRLPGTLTIPDQIVEQRQPYYAALDAADLAWAQGNLNVSIMEALLSTLLARQLVGVLTAAVGHKTQDAPE
jgi:Fic family protein